MTLFDLDDIYRGLTLAQFIIKLGKLDKKAKDELYLKAKDCYYDGDPILTDPQFDILEEDLKRSKSKLVKIVGGGGQVGRLTEKHMTPMLSLDKKQVNDEDTFDWNSIADWFKNVPWPLEASCKYDGNGVELQYANGQLVKAITRGKNGLGKDITTAMRLMVPEFITSNKTLEIRGEVVMPLDLFEQKYYKETGVGEDAKYANARNMVGGVLGDDAIPVDKLNDCVFVAYSAKAIELDGTVLYVADTMNNLKRLGFNTKYDPPITLVHSVTDIKAVYYKYKAYRASCAMQLDGIVFKVNENLRTKYGENNHHPKWSVAVKFPSMIVQTTIIGKEWNVGPTGDLSPVGLLKPVELDGTVVKRCSLYNKGKMEERGLFPGAIVEIKKSGDIIPAIVNVISPSPDTASYIKNQNYYPHNCPSCNSVLVIDNQHIRCVSNDCPAQKSRQLAKSIAALNIKGIGESTCEDLYKCGIKDIFDFFDMDMMSEEHLTESNTFVNGRSLDIIVAAPWTLKTVDLDKVILALGIPRVGRTISMQLARMYAGISYSFDGLETAVVQPFTVQTSQETHLVTKIVDILRDRGVTVNMPVDAAINAIGFEMTGKTGNTEFKTKEELVDFLKTKGYVNRKLKDSKILLTESYSSDSAKMKEAKKRGIQIFTYEDFLQKIN